jgi:uncharacterized membrane protein YgcG
MRASRTITVTLLSALMLSSCCYGVYHRGRDRTWYDASGRAIVEKYKTDAQGNQLRDTAGRPIPDPDVPRDRYGRPWVFVNGAWQPQAPPSSGSSSSSYRSSSSWFGGSSSSSSSSSSGYRTFSSSGSSSPSSSVFGGSSSSSSSISRGGFGSTGMGGSSSSS